MPDTRRVTATGGVELAVDVWAGGPGTPFLLVHGLASNRHLWAGVAAELAALGHPVAAVDQRGHGTSDKPDDGYDFATVTADLVAVIDGLGLERPVAAGQSWGGNVVVELAARHPDRVRGIACVDGGWIQLADQFPDWPQAEERLAPPATTGLARAELEAMLRGMHPDWPETGIAGALACFEVRSDDTVSPWLTRERHMAILRELWAHRPTERWAAIDVPVLLVPCATGDRSWDDAKRAGVASAEAALRRWRTRWFDAHHDVHAQHPVEVARLFHECVEEGFFA